MPILSMEQLAVMIGDTGAWSDDGHAFIEAMATATAESDRNTSIFNGSCCYGLFQIHLRSHWSKIPGSTAREKIKALRDGPTNIKLAEQIYNDAGGTFEQDWTAHGNAKYKKALPEAERVYGNYILGELNESNPLNKIPNPLGGIQDMYNAIKAALGWITEPHNWLRIATFLGGMAILLLAGGALLANSKTASNAMNAAAAAKGFK